MKSGLLSGLVVCVVALLAAQSGLTASGSSALSPATYAEVSTGVGHIVVRDCSGRLLGEGSGFLIGAKVLMTATHVVSSPRLCSIKAVIDGRVYRVERNNYWYSGDVKSRERVDVSTLKLSRRAPGHVFEFAKMRPARGQTVAMIGHPLGNPLSLSQGKLGQTRTANGVPTMYLWMLSAQGASGSPLLNQAGKVVGILQRGYTREDEGWVAGIDLVRWWGPRIVSDLCRAYPNGGIAGCTTSKPKPPPPSCSDRSYLTAVGPTWQNASESWNAWESAINAGDSTAFQSLRVAFSALYDAADVSAPLGPCSAALKRAEARMRGVSALVQAADTAFEAFIGTSQSDPAYQSRLGAASAALNALGSRVDAIDGDFATGV